MVCFLPMEQNMSSIILSQADSRGAQQNSLSSSTDCSTDNVITSIYDCVVDLFLCIWLFVGLYIKNCKGGWGKIFTEIVSCTKIYTVIRETKYAQLDNSV